MNFISFIKNQYTMGRSDIEKLIDPGYIVFENILPNKKWFSKIYSDYDAFSKSDNVFKNKLTEVSDKWLSKNDNLKYYCSAPPTYRERFGSHGKDVKDYLQWTLEFFEDSIVANSEIYQNKHFSNISRKLKKLHSICSEIFMKSIEEISSFYPQFKNRYDENRPLPIIFKIVRYKKNVNKFGTPPHFDKSALSLILDSDDQTVRWRVGKGNKPKLSEMIAPFDYPSDQDSSNHAILFPGLCLNEINIDINPTPHYVKTVDEKEVRHSLIAFLLVPNLEGTEHLITKADYINDINPDII